MIPLLYEADWSNSPRHHDSNFRIMVLGDPKVGKTSMIMQWLTDNYRSGDEATYSDDIYRKKIPYYSFRLLNDKGLIAEKDVIDFNLDNSHRFQYTNKDLIKLEILDANIHDISEYYSNELRSLQVKQSDAIVICFDGKSQTTFEHVREYYNTIKDALGEEQIPVVICNTKIDYLMEDKVEFNELINFLAELDLDYENDYFETSSKHNINVKELLFSLLYRIETNKEMKKKEEALKSETLEISPTPSYYEPNSPFSSRSNKSDSNSLKSLDENRIGITDSRGNFYPKCDNKDEYLKMDDLIIPSEFITKTRTMKLQGGDETKKELQHGIISADHSETNDTTQDERNTKISPIFKTFPKFKSSTPPKPISSRESVNNNLEKVLKRKEKQKKDKKDTKMTPPFKSTSCIIS